MDAKNIRELVQLKDVGKIIAKLTENGWREAKETEYLGEVSLVDLFTAKELYSSPLAKLPNGEYLSISLYDEVFSAKDWTWLVIFHDRKFRMGTIPKSIKIFVKKKGI